MESTEALVEQLRLRIGERIPNPGSEADTMFSDAELAGMIEASDTILQATVLGWQMKASELARLVDMTEGDSSRKLSQRYENARKQIAVWSTQLSLVEGVGPSVVSVVGVPIEYLRPNEDEPVEPVHPFPNYPYGF
jgi:hypothetical protein